MTDKEAKIRQRAYSIWEKEGYPHGRAEDHWHRALREVEAPPAEAGAAAIAAAAAPAPAEKPAPKRRKAAAATTAAAPRKRTVKKS